MPQVWVTLSPGAASAGPSPVSKAFGGQVIGSMATRLAAMRGSSASPVNTCSQS